MTATAAPPDEHELTLEEERKKQVPPEQLALPMIDKRKTDAIELQISGTIQLDRSDPEDCALIRRLKLGDDIKLMVDATVVERAGRTKHDRDGYFEGSTLVTKIKASSITRPAGEADS